MPTLFNRVKETSISTGIGDFILDGAVIGFQSFSETINSGETYYVIEAIASGVVTEDWEVGIGTLTGSTLARTIVLASSNSGSAVNFDEGTKNVFLDVPASEIVYAGTTYSNPSWLTSLAGSKVTGNITGEAALNLTNANTWTGQQVFNATTPLVVRQNGGVAGTDEVQISHTGTKALIESKDGLIDLKGTHSVAATAIQLSSSYVADKFDFYASTLGWEIGTSTNDAWGMFVAFGYPILGFPATGDKVQVLHSAQLGWSADSGSTSDLALESGIMDIGFARKSAGVVALTNGSTGAGTLSVPTPSSGAGLNLALSASSAASGNTNGGDVLVTPGDNSGSGVDGRFIIRQPGGVAADDECYIYNDGSRAIFQSGQNELHLKLGPFTGAATNGTFSFRRNDGLEYGRVDYQNFYHTRYCHMGNVSFSLSGDMNQLTMMNTFHQKWSSTTSHYETADIGLTRNAAGVLRVSDGSTGIGKTLTATLVEANTAGSGSPNVLTAAESRTLLTNEGTTAQNYHTLPTAVAGLDFEFICQDADGIRVVANTGDTIRDVATVSATAGYIQSTTIGSVIRLKAINATEWFVVYKQGTWTIDS